MKHEIRHSSVTRSLVAIACFVVIVAGMKAASSIVVPFLLALFIAVICAPPLFWLQRKGVPKVVALLIILSVVAVVGVLLVAFLGESLSSFTSALPVYQERLSDKTAMLVAWLRKMKIDVPDNVIRDSFNPGMAMKLVGTSLLGLSGVLTNTFMILLTVVFILVEASEFSTKLRCGLKNSKQSLARMSGVATSLNRYIVLKTVFSLATGVLVAIWLSILGVDFALLWGLIAFLLNYVPTIGSIIAAIPAVLLALVQLGVGSACLTALGFLVINAVLGNILEPRLMGRGLGLSPLVVFLSMVFWGWVLGPVGMFLSAPLTMIVKIILEANQETRGIALMLGNESSVAKRET